MFQISTIKWLGKAAAAAADETFKVMMRVVPGAMIRGFVGASYDLLFDLAFFLGPHAWKGITSVFSATDEGALRKQGGSFVENMGIKASLGLDFEGHLLKV